jgi:hypothetical protein
LALKQGWFLPLSNGEKVINAPVVFIGANNISRVTFGTYAPLAQLNQCTPPGEARLNEVNSLTGDYVSLPGSSPGSRYYQNFLGRGYVSSSQQLVLSDPTLGNVQTRVSCIGPRCQFTPPVGIGAPTKIYWYLEPEQ